MAEVSGGQNGKAGDKSKRDRLQRHPSFKTIDDDSWSEKKSLADSASNGRRDYFGVRSYLHHFYDTHSAYKDPNLYEFDKYDFHPRHQRRCPWYWWKKMAVLGALCLVVGVVVIVIGMMTPKSSGELNDDEVITVDSTADVCRLAGLVLFCVGGMVLAVAFLIPTYCYHRCADPDADDMVPVIVDRGGWTEEEEEASPLPVKAAVPVTEKVTEVQPPRKATESVMISDSMIPYNDYD